MEMQPHIQPNKLTNLQLELLKIFSKNIPNNQLLEIKGILSKYFADKASDEFEKLAEQNEWTAETYKHWLKEHNRATGK
jgi:hypothetical protein